jgi:integrase
VKRHLTDASVQRIKPPTNGSSEIFDLGYPGLALRIGHGGAKTFELFYRINGKLRRETLGRWPAISLADARNAWRKTREAIARGETPRRENEAPAMLFERVAEEWIKRDQAKNKPSSLYQVARSLEVDLLPAWRGKRIDEIGKRDVIELLDSIADRGAPLMARRVQSHVKRLFRWCVERDILKIDPTQAMPRVGNGKSRDRVLTDNELAKVWAACHGPYGAVVRMLALTGARRDEMAQLRWSEIDGATIKLEGSRTKNGEPHIIPISAAAEALLNSLPHLGDFVFSGAKPVSNWGQSKRRLDGASGVTNWRIHDLRRTVATGMQRLGVNLQTIEAVLGHTSGSRSGVVGVYQRHSFDAEKRAALEAWGAHLAALIGAAQ